MILLQPVASKVNMPFIFTHIAEGFWASIDVSIAV
jgi:hypothetical protein